MREYSFTMEYVDVREISFLAENEIEAQEIMESGSWDLGDEYTIDFYANRLIKELHEVK